MPAASGYEFHHIHVFCSDLEATAHWFIEGVGATLVGRGESRGVPSVTLNLGGAPVLLRPAREGESLAEAGARRFGTDHFGLKVADIDAVGTIVTDSSVDEKHIEAFRKSGASILIA